MEREMLVGIREEREERSRWKGKERGLEEVMEKRS